MKFQKRELALLFLPCAALLLWGGVLARSHSGSSPTLDVHCEVQRLSPSSHADEGNTRIVVKMKTGAQGAASRLNAFRYVVGVGGHTYRWYYNSRVEGEYRGRKQIFYSSSEFDKANIWLASSNEIGLDTHAFRQRFDLSRIPVGVTHFDLCRGGRCL